MRPGSGRNCAPRLPRPARMPGGWPGRSATAPRRTWRQPSRSAPSCAANVTGSPGRHGSAMRSGPGPTGRSTGCGPSFSRPATTPRTWSGRSGRTAAARIAGLEADRAGLRAERDRLAAELRAAHQARHGTASPAPQRQAAPCPPGRPDQAGPDDRAGRAAPGPGDGAAGRGVQAGQRGGRRDRLQPGNRAPRAGPPCPRSSRAHPGTARQTTTEGRRDDGPDAGTSEPGRSDPAVAIFLAVAAAVLLAVRWLARLDWLGLAAIAAAVAAALFVWWAVRPQRQLPRNRVRHMRLRLRLRLHPGPGHATLFELWLRWGSGAAARRARRARPSLSWPAAAVPPVADLGAGRPRPVRARAAGPDRGARHLHRPAAQGQVRRAGGDHRAATPGRWWSPRPAGTCTTLTAAVPGRARAGARVEPAAAGRRGLHDAVGPAGRMPGPGHRDPPRRAAVRGRLLQGRGRGFLVRGDRAVAADAAARGRAAARQHGPGPLLGAVQGPRIRSWARCPARAGKPNGGAR